MFGFGGSEILASGGTLRAGLVPPRASPPGSPLGAPGLLLGRSRDLGCSWAAVAENDVSQVPGFPPGASCALGVAWANLEASWAALGHFLAAVCVS